MHVCMCICKLHCCSNQHQKKMVACLGLNKIRYKCLGAEPLTWTCRFDNTTKVRPATHAMQPDMFAKYCLPPLVASPPAAAKSCTHTNTHEQANHSSLGYKCVQHRKFHMQVASPIIATVSDITAQLTTTLQHKQCQNQDHAYASGMGQRRTTAHKLHTQQ